MVKQTNYFFAENKKAAIAYARKVNEKEGYIFIPISSIRLAKKQISARLKTWAFDVGKTPKR